MSDAGLDGIDIADLGGDVERAVADGDMVPGRLHFPLDVGAELDNGTGVDEARLEPGAGIVVSPEFLIG